MPDTSHQEYVEKLRDFIDRVSFERVRGIRPAAMPPGNLEEVEKQAEELHLYGERLSQQWGSDLASPVLRKRMAAEKRLLAEMAIETTLAATLASYAAPTAGASAERGVAPPSIEVPEYLLRWLENPFEPIATFRGAITPSPSLSAAKLNLEREVQSAIAIILSSTDETAQKVLADLLSVNASVVIEGLSLIGINLAEKVGVGATRLMLSVIRFVSGASRRLRTLLGEDGIHKVEIEIQKWEEELQHGTLFTQILEKTYGLKKFSEERKRWFALTEAPTKALDTARERVIDLGHEYPGSTEAVEHALKGLALVKMTPMMASPVAQTAVAGIYAGLLGYTVYNGYDYIGARGKFFDRVEGIKDILINTLRVQERA